MALELVDNCSAETAEPTHHGPPLGSEHIEMYSVLLPFGRLDLLKTELQTGAVDHDVRVAIGRQSAFCESRQFGDVVRAHFEPIEEFRPESSEGCRMAAVEDDLSEGAHGLTMAAALMSVERAVKLVPVLGAGGRRILRIEPVEPTQGR